MKTVEDKLKIWSNYLPYNLETAYCDRHGDVLKVGVLNNIQYNESQTHPLRLSIEGLYELEHEWMFKPFLWSMDMLTKEIEHKGERLILADIIFPKEEYISDFERNVAIGSLQLQSAIKCSCTYYSVVQKLLEYHFNVFDLEESEYIQKQSVIQK